ncbi:interferon-like [Heliangelus exortis]|uniref:interferon-like n=1 Tax=Heliangelus exortis TaxID=472823 RepID=UPI003A94F12F
MAAPATPHAPLRHGVSLLLLLLLLLTPLATATACLLLPPPGHDTFLWDSIQSLQAMAPSPPHPCQQHQTPLFPQDLLHTKHPRHAAAAALSILQHLFAILSSDTTPPHWDHQERHRLLNNLHHHSELLQHCLAHNATLSQGQGPRNLLLNINRYFTRIQRFLHARNHSACAWDHLRLQAQASFQHLHNLTRTMHNHNTHPQPPTRLHTTPPPSLRRPHIPASPHP